VHVWTLGAHQLRVPHIAANWAERHADFSKHLWRLGAAIAFTPLARAASAVVTTAEPDDSLLVKATVALAVVSERPVNDVKQFWTLRKARRGACLPGYGSPCFLLADLAARAEAPAPFRNTPIGQ